MSSMSLSFACRCLNIRFSGHETSPGSWIVRLSLHGVVVEQRILSVVEAGSVAGTWDVRCLNCQMLVYSYERADEGQTFAPPDGIVRVDKLAMVAEQIDILKKSEEYSSVYGLILSAGAVPMPGISMECSELKRLTSPASPFCAVSSMTVEHTRLLDSFQNSLNAYAEKITAETEARIAAYRASQLAQLDIAKRRGTEERDRLMATIVARGVRLTASKEQGLETPTPSVDSGLSVPTEPTGASVAKSVEKSAEQDAETILAQFASSFRPRRMVPSGVSWKDDAVSTPPPPIPEPMESKSQPQPESQTETAGATAVKETASNVDTEEQLTTEQSESSAVGSTSLPQLEERSSPRRVKFVDLKGPETSEKLANPNIDAQPISENGIFDLEGVDELDTDQDASDLPTDNDVDEEIDDEDDMVEQLEGAKEGGASNLALLSSSVPIAIPGPWTRSKQGRSAPTGPAFEGIADTETGDSDVFVAPHIVTARTYAGETDFGRPSRREVLKV
ncbi:hypothetical protein BJ742DRAFT_844958 [Cladochytrium replicatum]|nr:hypothetical protein BJ742DRAFT_844958 [Cladochytrium replicatum]